MAQAPPAPEPEEPHLARVREGTEVILRALAGLEETLLPLEERTTAKISLLNADVLANVLAASYCTHHAFMGAEGSEDWLAEILKLFGDVVRRSGAETPLGRLPTDAFFLELAARARRLWGTDTPPVVPDALPPEVR